MSLSNASQYELRFNSLCKDGHCCAFPCDAHGHVDLDSMSDRERNNYLFARTVIGRDFAAPGVRPVATH